MQDRRSLNIENIKRLSIGGLGGKGMKNRRASVGFALGGGSEASPNPSLSKKRDTATSGEKKASRRSSIDVNSILGDVDLNSGKAIGRRSSLTSRRETINADDVSALLDNDDEDLTTHSNVTSTSRRLSVAQSNRRSTIDTDDVDAFLNDSTTSSRMEKLASASPNTAGVAAAVLDSSRRDTLDVTNIDEMLDQDNLTTGSTISFRKSLDPRRTTVTANEMDNLLNDSDEEEGSNDKRQSVLSSTKSVYDRDDHTHHTSASSLKSSLKTSQKDANKSVKKTARTSVMFGSPKVAEFERDEPTHALTPLDRRKSKALYSMEGSQAVEADNDEQTSSNSKILNQWSSLDDGSDTEEDDDEEEQGNSNLINNGMSNTAASRPSIGGNPLNQLRRRSSMHSTKIGRRSSVGSEYDRTQELESDLQQILDKYDYNQAPVQGTAEDSDNEDLSSVGSQESVISFNKNNTSRDMSALNTSRDLNNSRDISTLSTSNSPINAPVPTTTTTSNINKSAEKGVAAADNQASFTSPQNLSTNSESTQEMMSVSSKGSAAKDNSISFSDAGLNISVNMNMSTRSDRRQSTNGANNANADAVLNRLKKLNAGSRRNTLSQCETPTGIGGLGGKSRLSVGVGRQSLQNSAVKARIARSASKLSATKRDNRDVSVDDISRIEKAGLDTSMDNSFHDRNYTGNFTENFTENFTSDLTEKANQFIINDFESAKTVESEPVVVQPSLVVVKPTPVPMSFSDLLYLSGVDDNTINSSNTNSIASVFRAVHSSGDVSLKEKVFSCLLKSLPQCVKDASKFKGSLEATEQSWKTCSDRKMNTIVEAVGQDAVDIDEASHELAKKVLEPIGVRCSEQATSSWNAWESMQLLNMATSLEDYIDEIHNQIASVNEATQQVQEQQQEDETAFAQHTAALAQQEELTVLTEEIYTLRKEVEDMHTDAEKMSDETSSYLDKQKEQLLHFTSVMAEQSNTEERVKGRIAEQEKAIDDVQNKISHTRTLISITDKMMYHRLSYFQPEYVQLDLNINNVIKSEVGLKLDMNHDSAIHLGNINVNTKKFCDIFNNQDNMTDVYFTNVLSNDIVAGPLSETWMRNKEGEPFADICDIVRMISGYMSSLHLVSNRMRSVASDGWQWKMQGQDIVMMSPDLKHKVTVDSNIMISGNVAAISADSLRDAKDNAVAELPMMAVLSSLQSKYAMPLGQFCLLSLKRELESILKHL